MICSVAKVAFAQRLRAYEKKVKSAKEVISITATEGHYMEIDSMALCGEETDIYI